MMKIMQTKDVTRVENVEQMHVAERRAASAFAEMLLAYFQIVVGR